MSASRFTETGSLSMEISRHAKCMDVNGQPYGQMATDDPKTYSLSPLLLAAEAVRKKGQQTDMLTHGYGSRHHIGAEVQRLK